MKWVLRELSDYRNKPLYVSEKLDLSQDIMERYSKYVISANDKFSVDAYVFYDNGNAIVNAHVRGNIVVPSSRSLTPVDLPLNFKIDEAYVDTKAQLKKYEEEDVAAFLVDDDGLIDFDKSVADNIILQIPMHILSPDEKNGMQKMPKGNDWEVISEEEYNDHMADNKTVDPRLAKLKKLFNDSDK